jgi:hypothetical protein
LCETGIEQVDTGTPPLDPNRIVRVVQNPANSGIYEITLKRPISAGHWTTIEYDPTGSSVTYASLPMDVELKANTYPLPRISSST